MKVFFYTSFALLAFAFNSILCRLALGTGSIDAASFTAVRLISGAAALLFISSLMKNRNGAGRQGNWLSAFFLFAYAICFSFAYVGLTTGTGALILFGSVQATMIIAALASGERPRSFEWLGLFAALGGLVYLVLPGLAAPPFIDSLLMCCAGVAWGFYTLRGKGSQNPLAETTGNFARAVPLMIVAGLPFLGQLHWSKSGFIFAVISGAVTSGVGYAIWYAALRFHAAARAAILQLSVPVLAAIGGIVLLSETVTFRLLVAAVLILGGIGLAILERKKI